MQSLFTHRLIRIITLALVVVALLWFALRHVQAAPTLNVVVTNCSFQGLANVLSNTVERITFNCNGTNAPATISITQLGGLNVDAGSFWTIDGSSVITMTGLDTYRLFNVKAGGALTLANILLVHGYAGDGQYIPGQGGALLNAGGRLVLDHAWVQDSRSTSFGGAFESVGTTLLMNDSRVQFNQSKDGGGIHVTGGSLTLLQSEVWDNKAQEGDGGGLWTQGSTVVVSSSVSYNTVLRAGRIGGDGGGI